MGYKKPIHNRHDKLMTQILSYHPVAVEILQQALPEKWLKVIDFNNIYANGTTFVDPEFRQTESDVLFEVLIKNKLAYIYTLFEHQNTADYWLPLRTR